MKPTPQISREQQAARSFPLTDYTFQPTAEAAAKTTAGPAATESPAFYKLGSEFFGAEASRNYVAELLLFVLITGLGAWPIISALVAVTRMVRNY